MRVFVGGGLGATWVSGGFNETYYGVTSEDSQKCEFPVFNPGGGL
ncbi:MltA-interacting protein MipA [Caballeronia pedi]|uniref:MltA-interacting protein MipA n=1 Tax=Caballeronia pedi TaxID=1777141 RepID=A0A158DZZ2_9BURK|nr:MipA/OmpV family protein [Caballeronia pedi]SAL00211.1 MltA-interacting protein MipA [Caballeronia pedi]